MFPDMLCAARYGYMVRDKKTGGLQGFIILTTFTSASQPLEIFS
jgi:hypothetical protein